MRFRFLFELPDHRRKEATHWLIITMTGTEACRYFKNDRHGGLSLL